MTRSVDYVAERLRRAGYKVSFDEFDFPLWELNGPSTLAEVSPTARTFAEETDYIVSQFSGAGDVTADIVPTSDIEIPPPGRCRKRDQWLRGRLTSRRRRRATSR